MERIEFYGDSTPYLNIEKKEDKEKRKKNSKVSSFSSLLSTSSEEVKKGALEKLFDSGRPEDVSLEDALDEVHQLGEKLKENPTLARIKDYRKAVGGFVRYILKNGFVLSREKLSGFKVLKLRPGEQPEVAVVRIVDQKLNELGRQVLENQQDQLAILEKIDEIHGILVDLLT